MKIIVSVCLILILIGCANEKSKPMAPVSPMVGEFKAKSIQVGDQDRVIIVDVPDRYMPRRCVIYTGPNRSNMDCSFDAADNVTVISAVRNTD